MIVKDIIGIAMAIVVLAGLSVAIINGDKTAQVMRASGEAFSNLIGKATLQG